MTVCRDIHDGAGKAEFGRWFPALFIYAGCLQVALFLHDIFNPHLFLHADRAQDRMRAIRWLGSLLHGEITAEAFFSGQGTDMGMPGDYLIQGLLFLAGGSVLVIVVHLVLYFASVYAVFCIAKLTLNSSRLGLTAAFIYASLPFSISYPHMLWSEAIYNPALVLAYLYATRVALGSSSTADAARSASLVTVATLVRAVALPWAVVIALIFLLCRVRLRCILVFVFVVPTLLALWPVVNWSLTGQFSFGGRTSSRQHLQDALDRRISLLVQAAPETERAAAMTFETGDRSLSGTLGRYVGLCRQHTSVCVRGFLQDLLIYTTQSGVERLTVDLFELTGSQRRQIQEPMRGWRKELLEQGLWNGAKAYAERLGLVFLVSVFGALLFAGLWGFAAVGTAFALLDSALRPCQRVILLSMSLFLIYCFLPGSLVYFPQARYRSPAEFALCVLGVLGASKVRGFWSRERGRRVAG